MALPLFLVLKTKHGWRIHAPTIGHTMMVRVTTGKVFPRRGDVPYRAMYIPITVTPELLAVVKAAVLRRVAA